MKIPTKEEFFDDLEEADDNLKADLYRRLKKIEENFEEGKIAASKSDFSYGSKSIGVFLEGVSLNAPFHPILNEDGEIIGDVSLPNNLKDFFQIFCAGSTYAAYIYLKKARVFIKHLDKQHFSDLITDVLAKSYFIDIINQLYIFHIGNNPKYATTPPIKALEAQLDASTILRNHESFSEDAIKARFLESFQVIFNKEPRAIGDRSFHPLFDGYCQVCHHPNIPHKKYCHNHNYNPISRNSSAKTLVKWAKKSFRNLGYFLMDEEHLVLTNPNDYIQEAKEKRTALAKSEKKLKTTQSKILSEYFIRLEGWAKHHPTYSSFSKPFKSLLDKYENTKSLKDWKKQECLNLFSETIELCKEIDYFPNKIFPNDLKHISPEDIKSILLGKNGLDIKPDLHLKVTIDQWATMLCRYYQFELIYMCRKKDKASLLSYTKS